MPAPGAKESVVLDIPAELRPPSPFAPGAFGRARVLAKDSSSFSIGRVAVVSDPAAIRRVRPDNCDNYAKKRLRRALPTGLTGGLPAAGGYNRRSPHSKTI